MELICLFDLNEKDKDTPNFAFSFKRVKTFYYLCVYL